ncbi:probable inactive receptor kinase RLK902 [Fagus crenata]
MRSWLRNHFFKRTEERKERERAFLKHGSMLLEQLIVSCNAKPIPIPTFSAQELRQATDNYANEQFWGWYKGSLEGRMVFVNLLDKCNVFSANLIINDLVISAQMSGHELLTGEDSSQITRLPIGEDTSLVEYMHNSAQGRSINEIVDPAILAEE